MFSEVIMNHDIKSSTLAEISVKAGYGDMYTFNSDSLSSSE